MQRGPIPMTPSVIFSLGATFPSRPRTRAGSTVANEAAAVAAAVPRRNSRRVVLTGRDMIGGPLVREGGSSKKRYSYMVTIHDGGEKSMAFRTSNDLNSATEHETRGGT